MPLPAHQGQERHRCHLRHTSTVEPSITDTVRTMRTLRRKMEGVLLLDDLCVTAETGPHGSTVTRRPLDRFR